MSAKAITPEAYAAMETYLMQHPGDVAGCRRACGVVYRTAQKAWFGWPDHRDALRAEGVKARWERMQAARREISAELEADIAARRARADAELQAALSKAQTEATELLDQSRGKAKAEADRVLAEARARLEELNAVAQVDARETQAQEIALVRASRGFGLYLKELARQLMETGALERLVRYVSEGLASETMKPKAALQMLKDLAWFGRTMAEWDKLVLEEERLRIGEPTAVVAVQVESLSEEEAMRRLRPLERLGKLIAERQLGPPPEDAAIEVAEPEEAAPGVEPASDAS